MFHSNSWLHTTSPVSSAQSMASVQCPKPHNSQYQWRYASLRLTTGSFLLHICGKQCTNLPGFHNLHVGSHQSQKSISHYCFLFLFNLAGWGATAQTGKSNVWQTQAYSRHIYWHSSVIQGINFWIPKQATSILFETTILA